MNRQEDIDHAFRQLAFMKALLERPSTRENEVTDQRASTRMPVANMFHGLDLPFNEEETIWVSVK